MRSVVNLLKQQIEYLPLIIRLAIYEIKGKYQMHYLGVFWQFLNPMIQVSVYWFVFGVGIRKGAPVGDTPFFIWLLIGLVPWFFIAPTIVQASNSIYSKVNLVSKMKFPVSILPSIVIISNAFNFLVMFLVVTIILVFYGINIDIHIIQLPYYTICLFLMIYAVTIFTSTISALIRDFQLLVQSLMRMMFFLTPIIWSIENFDQKYHAIIKLNPFGYIINGFRETMLGKGWFYEDLAYTFYFWAVVLVTIFIGSKLHENFKNKFVDYL